MTTATTSSRLEVFRRASVEALIATGPRSPEDLARLRGLTAAHPRPDGLSGSQFTKEENDARRAAKKAQG